MIENKKDNLMIENKKEDLPIELQIYNKLKNKELLTSDEMDKYEEIQNMMFPNQTTKSKRKSNITRRKTFGVP